jgi:DNA-binding NarL/FixJ family response regulator
VANPALGDRERIDIVLADDHTMVRRGLRMVLDSEPDLEVVAEAADVESALHRTREHRPAVVVLDLNMPGTPTLSAIERFLALAPSSAVVVLTMEADPGMAQIALAAGAKAYVLKEGAETGLIDAVRAAAAGRTYLDPGLGARMATSAPGNTELRVGSTFAGHRIDAVAGRGGMGIVYRAKDVALERPVALKLIAPGQARDPVFRARFERECRLAASLEHPNVVTVFHAGEEQGRLYVTMRFIDGIDLRALLRAQGPLDAGRAVAMIEQVAGALDEAHAAGLVHRDVKPANILVRERHGEERAYLTDFGVSKHRTSGTELTGTGFAIGTPDYMAPEQARGRPVDARADVYSLGCVLFHALSGRLPFDHESDLENLWAHVHEPVPDLGAAKVDLPGPLIDAIRVAMAKDPADRPASAGALARMARAALAD